MNKCIIEKKAGVYELDIQIDMCHSQKLAIRQEHSILQMEGEEDYPSIFFNFYQNSMLWH